MGLAMMQGGEGVDHGCLGVSDSNIEITGVLGERFPRHIKATVRNNQRLLLITRETFALPFQVTLKYRQTLLFDRYEPVETYFPAADGNTQDLVAVFLDQV